MRILFASTAGAGHLGPLVPVARACLAAGHDVVVTAPASFAGAVERSGLAHFAFDDVPAEVLGPIFAQLPHLSTEEANRIVVRDVFAGHDARAALPGVNRVIDEWWPHLVVRDPAEFGSLAAALRAGIPTVEVAIGMGPPLAGLAAAVEEPLAELDALAGLDPGTTAAAAASAPLLTSVPASLDGEPGVVVGAGEPRRSATRSATRSEARSATHLALPRRADAAAGRGTASDVGRPRPRSRLRDLRLRRRGARALRGGLRLGPRGAGRRPRARAAHDGQCRDRRAAPTVAGATRTWRHGGPRPT